MHMAKDDVEVRTEITGKEDADAEIILFSPRHRHSQGVHHLVEMVKS